MHPTFMRFFMVVAIALAASSAIKAHAQPGSAERLHCAHAGTTR